MRRCSRPRSRSARPISPAVSRSPCSMFQTTSGLSWSRCAASSGSMLGGVLRRAQGGEHLDGRAQVRRGLLDRGSQLGEARRGPPADRGDLGVDRRDAAEVGREGDPAQAVGRSTISAIGYGGRVVAERVARVEACQHVEEQGDDRARRGPSALDRERAERQRPWGRAGRGPARGAGPRRRRTRPACAASRRGPSRRRARPCRSPAPPPPRPRSRRR